MGVRNLSDTLDTARLDQMSWYEVDAYLANSDGIFLPVGSTEQHGPMGLIGTDAICAEKLALAAAKTNNSIVAPTLAYTPAHFNTAFPGTISLSVDTFKAVVFEVLSGLQHQGFGKIYILNGHGANIEPINHVIARLPSGSVRIKSWWDFQPVQQLRQNYFGEWEGMHATPAEISITQAFYRSIPPGVASEPPEKLSQEFIAAHAGDKHSSPKEHRAQFPDGRVGSHSALARPEYGQALIEAACSAISEDFAAFCHSPAGTADVS